jgi:hypothetical protein
MPGQTGYSGQSGHPSMAKALGFAGRKHAALALIKRRGKQVVSSANIIMLFHKGISSYFKARKGAVIS